jgi:hypothetical protein
VVAKLQQVPVLPWLITGVCATSFSTVYVPGLLLAFVGAAAKNTDNNSKAILFISVI